MVRGVDVDPEGESVRSSVRHRTDGRERFGQHAGGAAVPETHGLGVARHRHPPDDSFGGQLEDLQAHLGVQRTRRRGEPFRNSHRLRVRVSPRAETGRTIRAALSGAADRVTGVATATTPAPTRPKLLLIDGHSVAYRAFFALPVENFSTQTGQHTNGVFGFTSMLINVLRDEQPTHIGVAFDVSRQTFRAEIYVDYKANRSKTPDEFRGQLDLVKEVLDALNIAHLEKPGYEADDVIATLATQAEHQGFDVLICSGDRDAFQLVTDNVTVLYPDAGSPIWLG